MAGTVQGNGVKRPKRQYIIPKEDDEDDSEEEGEEEEEEPSPLTMDEVNEEDMDLLEDSMVENETLVKAGEEDGDSDDDKLLLDSSVEDVVVDVDVAEAAEWRPLRP